jgi:hypothetical protein
MTAEEPGPLPRGLLDRLASRPDAGGSHTDASPLAARSEHGASRTDASPLAADLAVLRDSGYLKLALPARFGGAGLGLADLACAQRQLAARAPATAWAVNAHHAWIGAAADALAADPLASEQTADLGPGGAAWVLGEAARGRVFAGFGAGHDDLGAGHDDLGAGRAQETPGWDWLAGRRVDTRQPGGPAIVYGFTGRAGAGFRAVARRVAQGPALGAPGTSDSTLIAGMYAWGLALDGMTGYATARRTFEQAVERAQQAGLSLDRWPVAEASLRLDDMRGGLDEVIASWRQRVAAGGGVASLDPGRLGLIRQFTARHMATDGARRVLDLAALIAGHPVAATR